jgi:stearoyl-CoA desaturase (delta-9 desaturase)
LWTARLESMPRALTGPPRPTAADVEPAPHELADRIATGVVTAVPFLALGLVGWQVWDSALGWRDLAIFAAMYVSIGLGVTVGFHRLLTHRSFATTKTVRATLAALGSASIEGPVIQWVANHRKHHAFSDREGDPHSPHAGRGSGWRHALGGLFHAHLGWLFAHAHSASRHRYARDLIADPVIRFIDRTFLVWALAGLAVPFGLGIAIGGTVTTGLTGLLWGGAMRVFFMHHITYSINSLCHFFGRRRFPNDDESRNLLWLALPSLGEAWHNNHHAFPTSARHGLRRWEQALDPSGLVIRLLEACGLAWDVVSVSPKRQAQKANA